MISVYNLKPKFQKLLVPLLVLLRKLGISPNHITVFSVFFSIFIAYVLVKAPENNILFLMVSLGLLFRMMLNALDGMMAKKYNLQSKLGEILNEIGDIISDIAIYFPFLYFDDIRFEYVLAFILLSVINEFCGLLAKTISGERRYDGPMGKSDRALFVGLICIGLYFTNSIIYIINYLFILATILMLISSYLRLINSIKK